MKTWLLDSQQLVYQQLVYHFIDFPMQSHIAHFFANLIPPYSVAVLSQHQVLLPQVHSLGSWFQFCGSYPSSIWIYLQDDLISFPDCEQNPPGKKKEACMQEQQIWLFELISLSATHVELPTFHCMRIFHPNVVSCCFLVLFNIVTNASCCLIYFPLVQWSGSIFVEKCVTISLLIDVLSKEAPFYDRICSQRRPVTGWELYFIHPCFQAGAVIFWLCQWGGHIHHVVIW